MRKPKKKLKLKTNRGAAKRFRLTATGKVKRNQATKRHILTKKSQGRKRHLRKGIAVAAVDTPKVRRMLLG